jgi:DNA-nicking Smr family endonuclease
MRPPVGLTPEEAQMWRRLAATVTPLHPPAPVTALPKSVQVEPPRPAPRVRGRVPLPLPAPPPPPTRAAPLSAKGLDGSWDRKLAKGPIEPDRTIDLHGLTLDAAHARLDFAIADALASGARVILLIAGKPRPHDEHDARGSRRGAIRAKLLDWLAASRHAPRIAAVRPAQPRHGGIGAVYVVLRRGR